MFSFWIFLKFMFRVTLRFMDFYASFLFVIIFWALICWSFGKGNFLMTFIGLRVFMMKIFFRDWYGNGCEILKDWLFEKDLKFDFSPLMVQKPFFKNCVQFIIIITCNQEVSSHLVKDQLTETINVDHHWWFIKRKKFHSILNYYHFA